MRRRRLVSNLQSDEAKAKAWAEVLGIDAAEIGDFVKSLTPVTLRSATAVTNYSYADGTYRAAPATLAPGTAVFVNVYGEPTVKCYSGNPLTRGTSADPAVTTVAPARNVITHATYVNPTTNAPVKVENKPTRRRWRPRPSRPGPPPSGRRRSRRARAPTPTSPRRPATRRPRICGRRTKALTEAEEQARQAADEAGERHQEAVRAPP